MKKPLVSFIIPAFERQQLLNHTLQSVVHQLLTDWEVIIVDDGSPQPLKIPRSLQRQPIHIIRQRHNTGPAAARNLGLTKAKGEYVCFLDSDDVLEATFLTKILPEAQHHHSAVLCLAKPLFTQGYPWPKRALQLSINTVRNGVLWSWYLGNRQQLSASIFFAMTLSRMIFPRQKIRHQHFNEQMINCEDWDYILTYLDKHPVRILPQRLVQFRFSSHSWTEIGRTQTKWQSYDTVIQRVSRRNAIHPLVLAFKAYKWIFSSLAHVTSH